MTNKLQIILFLFLLTVSASPQIKLNGFYERAQFPLHERYEGFEVFPDSASKTVTILFFNTNGQFASCLIQKENSFEFENKRSIPLPVSAIESYKHGTEGLLPFLSRRERVLGVLNNRASKAFSVRRRFSSYPSDFAAFAPPHDAADYFLVWGPAFSGIELVDLFKPVVHDKKIAPGRSFSAVHPCDFNRDGLPDFLASDYNSRTISIFFNKGNNNFDELPVDGIHGTFAGLFERDIDGDGFSDICVIYGSTFSVVFGDASMELKRRKTVHLASRPAEALLTDVNSDGLPDLCYISDNRTELRTAVFNRQTGRYDEYMLEKGREFRSLRKAGDDRIALLEKGRDVILIGKGTGEKAFAANLSIFQNEKLSLIKKGGSDSLSSGFTFSREGMLYIAITNAGGEPQTLYSLPIQWKNPDVVTSTMNGNRIYTLIESSGAKQYCLTVKDTASGMHEIHLFQPPARISAVSLYGGRHGFSFIAASKIGERGVLTWYELDSASLGIRRQTKISGSISNLKMTNQNECFVEIHTGQFIWQKGTGNLIKAGRTL